MKRNLVLFSFLLAFGLLGAAGTAFAQQSTVFGVSSSIDQVRFEGTKEATGQVVLTSSSTGTIVGSAVAGSQTIITITYGANLAIAVGNANVSCSAAACAAGTNFAVTGAKGQPVVKITFLTNVTFAVGNTITISGIRVNANAFGSSGAITATAAAVVPAASSSTNAVTFSTNTTVSVANVNPKALTTTLSVGPAAFLTCIQFKTAAAPPDFQLTVKENFAQALTSVADENGLSGSGATQGSNILVTFTGVPKGVAITNSAITPDAALTVALDATTAATQTGAVANDTLTFLFDVNASDTTAIQKVKLGFTLATPATLPTGLTPNAITANVALSSLPTTLSPVPDFIDAGTNLTAVGISDCITNLLFPWIVVDAPGKTFDTGIALANTTKDVFTAGGAAAQAGSCVLTGFKFTDGSTVTTSVGPIAAGTTGTVVLSTVAAFAGFRGYVIAVCQFQNAHAFAFITQDNQTANGTSQGYLALVIPNPAIVTRNPAGGGAGEQLVH